MLIYIKTFYYQKAELAYEHIIEWIHTRKPIDEGDVDRFETSNEIVNVQEINEPMPQIDHVCLLFFYLEFLLHFYVQDSNDDDEIGSCNESNILSSAEK